MKKILLLLMGFSYSAFALQDNPIAPPKVTLVDKFGVNLQTGQLARSLNTISIGGKLGLSHHVQLYTDLGPQEAAYGFIDGFAGKLRPTSISQKLIYIAHNANGDPMFFREPGGPEYDHTKRVIVMRAYGPAGSQDFLMYQNNVVVPDASATTGYTFKAVGDARHTLTESADKSYFTWITPDGIESKYATSGMRLIEVTYPNGYKIRVGYKAVSTNTGFMLKYHFNPSVLSSTPSQVVGINLANQYCSADATSCTTTGWPAVSFTWPTGTPTVFRQSGLPLSSYLVKMTTPAGVTDIQYQPQNVCIKSGGSEDANCAANPPGGLKWWSRLRSIKTPESTVPNYQYTYENLGDFFGAQMSTDLGFGYGYTYWSLESTAGKIVSATLNGTDSTHYSGPSVNTNNAIVTRGDGEHIWVESSLYDLNVIESVRDNRSGTYKYHKDLRHFVEFYTPIKGLGPKQHYYYNGPRGNLNKITAVDASGNETVLQEVLEFASNGAACIHRKTCNKPTRVQDARGNVTEYYYDPDGRFGDPIKVVAPANKHGVRPTTVYNYEPMYAYYKKDSEAVTQDADPVWTLASEHTCRTTVATSTGCVGGDIDMVKTLYYYGPQNAAQPNNLLLRGKSITGEGNSSSLETRIWCYEYDKYGKLIGETAPKGNSNLQSCQ
ncbi:MAG: hypothetical protein B0W54_01355 [Cellvibrio sp. 79]|nr:MAG: hypothetical protein B0W54_01355 [Cellvibrio sp. 79]